MTFDKYSALQPGVSHFELDVTGFNPLGEQYIYSLEAEGIHDIPENHPYVKNSMIAIISDETCATFGLTPILNIDNNPDVKDEVEKLFAENTVPSPDYKYEKAEDFYDKVYYSDDNTKTIWAKTEIVDTFDRYDVIYDIDDLDEEVSPVSHVFAASKWSYIPAGLTIVPKDPYITDRDLYIVKKELSPLGFGTQDMYGNPPSHTPKCTNQFRCICFKGNEYKYVKESEISSNKDDNFMYMKQPVHSLHECKIAANTSGWNTKMGHNVDPAPVLVEHDESDFGCVRHFDTYVFYDIPYTISTTGHSLAGQVSSGFDNLVMGTKYSQTSSSTSATIYKLIRGKKVSTASTRSVLTRAEGARLHHETNITEPKSHIKQGEYSYFPISRDYTKIKYLKTDITYLHDNDLNPYRLIQEGDDYVFNNNYIEIYSHNMERQEGEYGEKPEITLTMLNVTTLDISIPQIITNIPDHVYNTKWSGIEVDVDIFENGVLAGGAHTQLKHIACRPLVKLAGEQSYYRLQDGTWVGLGAYEDLNGNDDARLCGHLPNTNVANSYSCTLSHSFPNQCPKDYGLGVSKWDGEYDHTTDTGDVPFVNGAYRQCSKCPEGTSSPDGHTRCLGHEHTITNDVGEFHTTIFDDPYHSYMHATHLQKYHFEQGNDYHPKYHTVGNIDYIDNEVYSDTRYLICKEGFVPKRQVIQPTWTSTCDLEWEHAEVNQIPKSDCIGFISQWNSNCTLQNGTTISNLTETECHEKDYRNFRSFCTLPDDTIRFTYGDNCKPFNGKNWSSTCTLPNSEESDISHNECILSAYEGTCSGYKCERCPDQFIEREQMCMPCAPGYVAGWALGSNTPNKCVPVSVPIGHFFDSQNSEGSTVGGTKYPYATHCDHWLYHPLGGIGAYQNETNQLVCKTTSSSGSMATFNGRVMVRPSVPGQKIDNTRTGVIDCAEHQVCDGEQIIGCKPGYIWYRQTDDREDEECALCNEGVIDHHEKDDYEYCDGTHKFQCADASYTNGTVQDGNYVGVRSTWTGSNLVKYESQEETSPARGHQYVYRVWNISQARVQENLPWEGSDAVCKAVTDGYFALDGEWKRHDCGYARGKCIHRTFHRIYPFRHPTNTATKYLFTEAVRETSYDEIFRMSSRQCDDGYLKDGCLKEYCSREGQTNCWCGEEEDFCRAACVDGMCLPACGDQVCNPDYEICYGIGVDAECTRKCNGPMDNYCVTDYQGYARLCRHYNEDWNTTKFEYLDPSSPCFEEMPNIPETQCKSTADRHCFCGREYHDDKHKACKDRKIKSSCSVIQDDGTCTYMTDSTCLCGDKMIDGIDKTCYQMNGKCGPHGSAIPDCDVHLGKIINTLAQSTTECRPTGTEALIHPAKCRQGTITKAYTGTIDNMEEKFKCSGNDSEEPGCMDRHADNYNQYAVIPKKCDY